MFTAENVIDSVTTAQKQAIKFVQNEAVKDAMVKFIDSQADVTKKIAKQTTDTVAVFASEFTKAAQEASKFDYNKATESFQKMFKVGK